MLDATVEVRVWRTGVRTGSPRLTRVGSGGRDVNGERGNAEVRRVRKTSGAGRGKTFVIGIEH